MKNYATKKIVTAFVAIGALAGIASTFALADPEGYMHRAWCLTERLSPGGWMSYRHDAQNHADGHRTAYPGHTVVIERMKQ